MQTKEAARTALTSLLQWGYEPLNATPVGHGIVESIGFKLRSRNVLPDREVNDGFIIAEAALFGCGILLSSDGHMTDANTESMRRVLTDCDTQGDNLLIASPQKIVAQFFSGARSPTRRGKKSR